MSASNSITLPGRVPGSRLTPMSACRRNGRTYYVCRCDCGAEKEVEGGNYRSGHTKSCGCDTKAAIGRGNRSHGRTESRAYTIWQSVRRRCLNEKSDDYPDYGGRGITVCDRWRDSFEAFFADMGDPPAGMSIERIDNAKGYEPGNCRWATGIEQGRNKRNNVRIAHDGRQQTVADWARELGISPKIVYQRIKNGWDPVAALTSPIKSQYRHHTSTAAGSPRVV